MFAIAPSPGHHFHRIENTDVLRDIAFGNLDGWRATDVIFTCSDFSKRVRKKFPTSTVVSVSDAAEFWKLSQTCESKRFHTIGIISPGLLDFAIADPAAMRFLCRLCSHHLLLWTRFPDPACVALRKSLHAAGFYEVVSEEGDSQSNRFDFSSVSCQPDGEHCLESQTLGFRNREAPYRTVVAFRCACDIETTYPWLYPLGTPPVQRDLGIAADNEDKVVLAVRSTDAVIDDRSSLFVSAKICWNSPLPTNSFVGLVGCHEGFTDQGMILLMLEAYSEEVAYLSLWESNDQWIRIMNMRIPIMCERVAQISRYFVTLKMEICDSFVEVNMDSKPLVRVYQNGLRVTNRFGMRMRGSQFVVEDLAGTIEHHE
jgi:hypothetical protein